MIVSLTLLIACTGAQPSGGSSTVVEDTGPVADYVLNLEPVVPFDENPFAAADRIDLVLDNGVDEPVRITLDNPGTGNRELAEGLPALDATRITVEGYQTGTLVAWGRTQPLTASTGEVTAKVFVAQPGALGRLGGLPEGAALGGGAALGDGRFVFMGGLEKRGVGGGKSFNTVSLLDLGEPDAELAFEEVGTIPNFEASDGVEYEGRMGFTLTPLTVGDPGQYLIVGGSNGDPYRDATSVTPEVRLFDPDSLSFSEALQDRDALANARSHHVAIANQEGGVLVWGGFAYATANYYSLATDGELYDPNERSFSRVTGPSNAGSVGLAVADLGANGSLVAGGVILNETNGNWEPTDANFRVSVRGEVESYSGLPPVAGHAMVGIADGDVLLFGGVSGSVSGVWGEYAPASADVWRFYHGSQTWSQVGSLELPRAGMSATLVSETKILIAGGSSTWGPLEEDDSALSCVEIYDTVNNVSTMLGSCTESDDLGGLSNRALSPLALFDPDFGAVLAGGIDGPNGPVAGASIYALTRD